MIEIDPNVRIENNWTFTYINYDAFVSQYGDIQQGDAVLAWEPESGMHFPATIVEMENTTYPGFNMYIALDVAWEKGKIL